MVYTVYIIYSAKIDRYYIGSTKNLDDRLHRHQQGRNKATTAGAPDWQLFYTETFSSNAAARQREHFIKRMKSRKFIEGLIPKKGD